MRSPSVISSLFLTFFLRYSNPEDVELERLEKYLQELVKFDDVRSELQRKYRIRDQVEGRALVTTEQLKQYF
jgi:hypothetical protein